MNEAKTLPTLASSGKSYQKEIEVLTAKPSLYKSTIRALQYVTITSPNISYMVNKLS